MGRVRDYRNVLPNYGVRFPRFHKMEVIRKAIDEVENNIQAPRGLVICSALSAVSLAAQGAYDVLKPNGHKTPCSLYFILVGESGVGKSPSMSFFTKAFEEARGEYSSVYNKLRNEWVAGCRMIDAQIKSVQRMVNKKVSRGESTFDEFSLLVKLEGERPSKPKNLRLLYNDSTPEALFLGMYEDACSAGLISAEGSSVLQGRALNDLAKYNSIWSGEAISVDRVSTERFELRDARLTISVMTQHSSIEKFLEQKGGFARGVGFFARVLTMVPESTQGERFIKNGTLSWGYIDSFSNRIKEILLENLIFLYEPKATRKVVEFSDAASRYWIEIYNAIEYEIRDGGRFEKMRDHASKLADNIARVAALLHVFEGFDGDISLSTLECAVDFCFICSEHFESIFMQRSQVEIDAYQLNEWLDRYRDSGRWLIQKNMVRQFCPNRLRNKDILQNALEELSHQGQLSLYKEGNTWNIDLRGD
ncbi:DUF3987 domain-containing protein [Pseudomonas sp. L-22-4S-12]|uniref:YfjI family protein n=1 Tax=Pseudomonas sp. L-22-4S-12 TaxID=2610893 RepID=UPI0013296BE5|nr:YfjI family protein [Pseudomonas sp. L-22-4S-12]MWV18281.1 DUF3987 domain-containing protein [Pseudomonas sp. L-22-4S-12]